MRSSGHLGGGGAPAHACLSRDDRGRDACSRSIAWSILFAFGLLALALCLPARGQFAIDWHTIDGGGGTSTGGVYSVSGSVGQPDASQTPMSGGNYSLTGGFWSLVAVQSPGAPLLKIVSAGPGQATISWAPASPGYVLQEALFLSSSNWVNSVSGTNNPITVPVPGDGKFYRLFKP